MAVTSTTRCITDSELLLNASLIVAQETRKEAACKENQDIWIVLTNYY